MRMSVMPAAAAIFIGPAAFAAEIAVIHPAPPVVVARGMRNPQPGATADDPVLPGMVIQLGR